jgi:hypothetical protein
MVNVESRAQRESRAHPRARRWAFSLPGLARLPIGHRSKGTSALLVSGLFHGGLLLILALCAIPALVGHDSVLLSSRFVSENDLLEVDGLVEIESLGELNLEDELLANVEMPKPEPFHLRIDLPLDRREADASPLQPNELDSFDPGTGATSPARIATEASTVEGAVDTVTGRIKGQLERGDLLVVWLLDASQSLVDDRRRVAEHLEPFFDEIAAGRGDSADHQLLNAVVSFGKGRRQRVEPTTSVRRVVQAVEKLPIDTSGEENVFAAIAGCVREYRETWVDGQLMIVVWMDETGDDSHLVEETIALCRNQRLSVSVVGPSSVLGAETGLHSYRDPKTKTVFQLPVKRGPDSAWPERIDLGYWFPTLPPGGDRGLRPDFSLPSWYGGRHLKGIASGFSPHALTRLAAKTGGIYTIFDRPEDRGPFRSEAMRQYAPEYQSSENYRKMVASHPLRHAVHKAVQVTLGKNLMAPETMLFVKRDKHQPFRFQRPYMTAAQFAGKLRTRRRALQRNANRQSSTIEEALICLGADGNPDRDLEVEFSQEKSPRWRAWYDLTRGRLLATSVRLEEYRLALDEIALGGSLQSTTNHVILLPSPELKSGSDFPARAAEAGRLLNRCVAQHPDTPWAYLAQRELAYGLGIFIRQMSLTPIPSQPAAPHVSLPRL